MPVSNCSFHDIIHHYSEKQWWEDASLQDTRLHLKRVSQCPFHTQLDNPGTGLSVHTQNLPVCNPQSKGHWTQVVSEITVPFIIKEQEMAGGQNPRDTSSQWSKRILWHWNDPDLVYIRKISCLQKNGRSSHRILIQIIGGDRPLPFSPSSLSVQSLGELASFNSSSFVELCCLYSAFRVDSCSVCGSCDTCWVTCF